MCATGESARHDGDRDNDRERARDGGDAGELQPDTSDDPGDCELWAELDDGVPGGVLWRGVDDTGDDDVHSWRQQRVRTVHANEYVHAGIGDESAGGDIGDAVKRA